MQTARPEFTIYADVCVCVCAFYLADRNRRDRNGETDPFQASIDILQQNGNRERWAIASLSRYQLHRITPSHVRACACCLCLAAYMCGSVQSLRCGFLKNCFADDCLFILRVVVRVILFPARESYLRNYVYFCLETILCVRTYAQRVC